MATAGVMWQGDNMQASEITNYIARIVEGFGALNVGDQFKREALRNIQVWLSEDEFQPYREQILDLVERGEFELLLDSFYQVLPFGTGGRRGPVGIGTNRINPWTIAASAQGHSDYLTKQYGEDARKRGVVLAYDVRKYPNTGIYSDELPNPIKGITSIILLRRALLMTGGTGGVSALTKYLAQIIG